MLTEIKTNTRHYYEDDWGRFQGEYKYWWDNSQYLKHCFYKDGNLHGEYKEWDDGQLRSHHFYQDNAEITEEVKTLVSDINNITQEEKLLIKLTYGIECLC